MRRAIISALIGSVLIVTVLTVPPSEALPTFARKYKTSCSTCHYAFPRLNKFGRAFKNNGLRYPGEDKDYAKQEPVSLGAESQKKVFPKAIWPSDLPGSSAMSVHYMSHLHYIPSDSGKEFTFENPTMMGLHLAGTLGEDIAFWMELEWEHADEFGFAGNIDFKFSNPFHIRLGNVQYLPIADHAAFSVVPFNYGDDYAELSDAGIEFWGAVNGAGDKGGIVYSGGLINGENSAENTDPNSAKDLFVKASYKIGGMGVLGSTAASESSAFWKDNSMTIGGFAHGGKSSDEVKHRHIGGNFDYFLENLNLFGIYMVSQMKDPGATDWVNTKRSFVEADYVIYPWLIPTTRFEYTKEDNVDAVRQLVPSIVIMARANVKVMPTALIDLDNSDENRYDLQLEVAI